MLQNTRYVYALSMWTVERRPTGWYFSKSAYHADKHDWRGPYSSEFSVTLMIARELEKEIKKRHKLPSSLFSLQERDSITRGAPGYSN